MADPTKLLQGILDSNLRIERILLNENKNKKSQTKETSAASGVLKSKQGGGENLKTLSEGVKGIAEGLAVFSKVKTNTVKQFVSTIDSILKTLNSINASKLDTGSKALNNVGIGLITFSRALIKSSLGLIIALPLIPVMGLSLKLFLHTFAWAGDGVNFARITRGGIVMRTMGRGLEKFAAGLALIGLTTAAIILIDPKLLIAIPASIALIAGTFGLIGIVSPLIRRGAVAMGFVSLALIGLSFGFASLTLSIQFAQSKIGKNNIIKTFGGFILIIGGLALTFGIAGIFAVPITLGAIALGAVGLSLIALGYGLQQIVKASEGVNKKTLNQIPELIKKPMFALAQVGLVAPLVLLGAGAALLVGPALIGIATGIEKINKIDFVSFNEKKFSKILLTLGQSFKVLGEGEENGTNYLKLLTGASLGKTPIERGISSAIKIGKALSSIAAGVGTWANLQNIPLIKGYDKNGNPIYGSEKVNVDKALEQINLFLPKLASSFVNFADLSGGKEGFSLLKLVVGNDLSISPMQRGISNAIKMGSALSSIAAGVGAWANLQNIKIIDSYDKNGKPKFSSKSVSVEDALSNIKVFLPMLQKSFEGFADGKEGFSISKFLFGNDLGKTPMQRGLSNALNMGKILKITAEGIGAWGNIQNIPLIKDYDKQGNAIYGTEKVNVDKAISNAVSTLRKISFAMIDVAGEEGDNVRPLRRALKAIRPLGEILTGTAEAINTFANVENIKIIEEYVWDEKAQMNRPKYGKESVDLNKITKNIVYTLTSISDAFSSQSKQDSKNTKRGIKALGPLGEILSGLAESINTFASIENIKIIDSYVWDEKTQMNRPIYSKNSVNVKKIAGNIKFSLSEIMSVFTSLEKSDRKKMKGALSGIEGIDEVLRGFADSIKIFARLEQLPSIVGYSMVNGKNVPQFGKPINAFDSVKNIKSSIVDVLSMINKVGGLATETTGKGKGKLGGVYAFEHLTGSLVKLAKYSKEFKSFAESFKSIATSMGSFADNFNKMKNEDVALYSSWTTSLIKFAEIDIKSYTSNVEKIKDKFDFGISNLKGKAKDAFGTDNPEEIKEKVEKPKDTENKAINLLLNEIKMLRGDMQGIKFALESELDVRVSNTVKIIEG